MDRNIFRAILVVTMFFAVILLVLSVLQLLSSSLMSIQPSPPSFKVAPLPPSTTFSYNCDPEVHGTKLKPCKAIISPPLPADSVYEWTARNDGKVRETDFVSSIYGFCAVIATYRDYEPGKWSAYTYPDMSNERHFKTRPEAEKWAIQECRR